MANSLKVTAQLLNSSTNTKWHVSSIAQTTTGDAYDAGQQNVGTSEESLSLSSDVSGSAGWAYFRNRDTTNFVEIGTATGVYPIRVPAGVACVVKLNPTTTTLYFKADTAACELEYVIFEV